MVWDVVLRNWGSRLVRDVPFCIRSIIEHIFGVVGGVKAWGVGDRIGIRFETKWSFIKGSGNIQAFLCGLRMAPLRNTKLVRVSYCKTSSPCVLQALSRHVGQNGFGTQYGWRNLPPRVLPETLNPKP